LQPVSVEDAAMLMGLEHQPVVDYLCGGERREQPQLRQLEVT
jgi:hypothetical protein